MPLVHVRHLRGASQGVRHRLGGAEIPAAWIPRQERRLRGWRELRRGLAPEAQLSRQSPAEVGRSCREEVMDHGLQDRQNKVAELSRGEGSAETGDRQHLAEKGLQGQGEGEAGETLQRLSPVTLSRPGGLGRRSEKRWREGARRTREEVARSLRVPVLTPRQHRNPAPSCRTRHRRRLRFGDGLLPPVLEGPQEGRCLPLHPG